MCLCVSGPVNPITRPLPGSGEEKPLSLVTLCDTNGARHVKRAKTSLNFEAGYRVKYTFNAQMHVVVIAEHQFAMLGAMYSMCLSAVAQQPLKQLFSSGPHFILPPLPLCEDQNRRERTHLIITHRLLQRWSCDQPGTLLQKSQYCGFYPIIHFHEY